MTRVGIRELKQHTSKILRRVREEGETIDVTYRGEVVARLIPAKPRKPSAEELESLWKSMDELAAEIGAKWTGSPSAVDAVGEVRREL
jgi:prevent-host-death family protein